MLALLSFGRNWKYVKDWKNLFLAAILDRDAFDTMIPFLRKQFSVLLIGRLKTLAWLWTNKGNLGASELYASVIFTATTILRSDSVETFQ